MYCLDANHVGKYERGKNRWPRRYYREAFCAVLGAAAPAELGFYPTRSAYTTGMRHLVDAGGVETSPAGGSPDPQLTASPTGLDVVIAVAGSMRHAIVESVDDPAVLARHAALADHLAGMYRAADPRVALPVAAGYADRLAHLLDHATASADALARLVPLVVGVHAQVGLWACHADRPSLARRYLAAACEIAADADDAVLRARAMGALSYRYSSAGWLATWRADQYVALGDLHRARRDIDLATVALGQADDGYPSGFFSRRTYGYGMQAHLDSVRATVHALLGKDDQATRLFADVHAAAANSRRHIATLSHRAMEHSATGEAEAASVALQRSVAWAVADGYGMGLRRALGVRATFDPAWSALPAVRDLDEQFAAARTRTESR